MRISLRLVLALVASAAIALSFSSYFQLGREKALLLHTLVICLVAFVIVQWSVAAPIRRLADWMRHIRSGEVSSPPPLDDGLKPLAAEAANLAKSLAYARAAVEEEARLRQSNEAVWTAERLKEHVKVKLHGRPLFVVANREPYMHVREGGEVSVLTPASGLVTGIEPILRACGGLWLAQGSGNADRETADAQGKLRVPPDDPQYTLKRVWLTKEEETGYYYGFSNEGLWPLCHIAHTRPLFDAEDWKQYQAVNRKFAESLLEEMEGMHEPFILVQDYHYALLPRLVKEARPDARVAIFWHIPWPNPEAFGICPWQKEILLGMLGADLVGFHIQFHCNNFLETVDRTLESRLDWERFSVQRAGHSTLVRPYPISIAFPSASDGRAFPSRQELFKRLGVAGRRLGVGVDRVDYTKGIVERFRGIESFLDANPEHRGEFVFVELAAPSRTFIKSYRDLLGQIEAEAARINARFASKDWRPIVLLKAHHSHEQIEPFYRAADLCMVTSLHDGMNLVAKEFVASREDGRGVLILSRFTGASRELRDALIVNPYDASRLGDAVRTALEMPPEAQARRMAGMRATLRENNVYLWASRLIEDLAKVPSDARGAAEAASLGAGSAA